MHNRRLKKRQREIEFDKLETLKEVMGYSWGEIAELLGVGRTQLFQYRSCGKLPATRYLAARDALLVDAEQRAREEREQILKLFNSNPNH